MTAHAINASLLFILCRNFFKDFGIGQNILPAFAGALIYAVCPHVSEVIVCKAYSHYQQGFLFILLIMLWVRKYQLEQRSKYAWYAGIIFFLSAFALEIFYLEPVFVFIIAVYYYLALHHNKQVLRKTLTYFFLPQVIMFALYFIGLYATYKFMRPHNVNLHSTAIDYLSKPAKYLFHILFLGRYFSMHVKGIVYGFCESIKGIVIFYSLIALVFIYSLARLNKFSNYAKVMFLLFIISMVSIVFLMGVSFPENSDLLVFYDRYSYFSEGFIYTLLAMFIARYVNRYVGIGLFVIYALINLYFTVKLNTYWKHSNYIDNRLLRDLPPTGNKTIILLNIPESLKGIPMIGAQPEGEFKMTYETLIGPPPPNTIYDAMSYNMLTDKDGAHVTVINDSTIRVTLNQWGTWWWYAGHGGISYQNNDYKLNLVDLGHWYELTLKHPADNFLLLFETGDQWKVVDMTKKNEDQY